jgi:hypothetical protein
MTACWGLQTPLLDMVTELDWPTTEPQQAKSDLYSKYTISRNVYSKPVVMEGEKWGEM